MTVVRFGAIIVPLVCYLAGGQGLWLQVHEATCSQCATDEDSPRDPSSSHHNHHDQEHCAICMMLQSPLLCHTTVLVLEEHLPGEFRNPTGPLQREDHRWIQIDCRGPPRA